AVPRSQREGALALGATRWQMIRSAVLPYARPGIVAACFLALGRALGETMAVTMLIGNVTDIDLSLFAKGNSIASIIANQLNEASSSLHRSALVALGLLLFGVTALVNILARLLIRRVGRVGRSAAPPLASESATLPLPAEPTPDADAPPPEADGQARPVVAPPDLFESSRGAEWTNRLMTGVLFLCLAVTLGPLFLILGYVTYRGVSAVNLDFFTKLPAPMGEPGGGMANALLGSGILVGLATLLAVPLGLLTAIYLAEYRPTRLSAVVRFITELLGGVPSIIMGIFAYAVLVRPPWAARPWGFSAWAGALALAGVIVPPAVRAPGGR